MEPTTPSTTSEELISLKIINKCTPSEASVRRYALPERELTLDAVQLRAFASFHIPFAGFYLTYLDDEGDQIKVGTTDELLEAVRLSKERKDLLRLTMLPTAQFELVTGQIPSQHATASQSKASPSAPARSRPVGAYRNSDRAALVVPILLGLMAVISGIYFGSHVQHQSYPAPSRMSPQMPTPPPQPNGPLCTHYLQTIYTDPDYYTHQRDHLMIRDWSSQLRLVKVVKCGEHYYFQLDGKHSTSLDYKRWNNEAWTATIRPGADIKINHVKANSGGRTSFQARTFEVTNAIGQKWASSVAPQHEIETSGIRLNLAGYVPNAPSYNNHYPQQQQQTQPQPQQQSNRAHSHLLIVLSMIGLITAGAGFRLARLNISRRQQQQRQLNQQQELTPQAH